MKITFGELTGQHFSQRVPTKLVLGWGGTIRYIREFLQLAQEEHVFRQQLCEGKPAPTDHERKFMLEVVNELRNKCGKAPVPIEQIIHAENYATYAGDYLNNFAVACAKIVVDAPLMGETK